MAKVYIAIQCSSEQCSYCNHKRDYPARPSTSQDHKNYHRRGLVIPILYARRGDLSLFPRSLCCPWWDLSSICSTSDLSAASTPHYFTERLHLGGCTQRCSLVPATISLCHCNMLWLLIWGHYKEKEMHFYFERKNILFPEKIFLK